MFYNVCHIKRSMDPTFETSPGFEVQGRTYRVYRATFMSSYGFVSPVLAMFFIIISHSQKYSTLMYVMLEQIILNAN